MVHIIITETTTIINEPKEIKQYVCSDGTKYDFKGLAEIHETYENLMQKAKNHTIKQIDSIYDEHHETILAGYCETKKDLQLLCDIYAYSHPYYNSNIHDYTPNTHEYSAKNFTKPDWYLLQYKYNGEDYDDDYWIDTLEFIKGKWSDFLAQFTN